MASFDITRDGTTRSFDLVGTVSEGENEVGSWSVNTGNQIVVSAEGQEDDAYDVVWRFNDDNQLCIHFAGAEVFNINSIPDTRPRLQEAGPRSFELVASRVPEELKGRIREAARLFREAGDTVTAHIDGGDAGPELAAAVHAAGGRVLSLVPERENLEAWFVRVIQREGGGGPA